MNYLLDTCLVSELIRPQPDEKVVAWLDERDEASLFLSVLTVGELSKGIAKLAPGKKREALQAWLDGELTVRFKERLIPVDAAVAAAWGQLPGQAECRGEKLPVTDALIAASARAHQLTVVTRNVADLERFGARVINPWLT